VRLGLLAACVAMPALAAEDPYYPAAQCAAFWLGRDDYAQASTFLDADPTDAARAAAFRAVAVRLAGEAGPIDAFLRTERRAMARLVEAYIYGGDDTSRDLHDRLLETCQGYAATQAETRDLP
jgi:hypothetical protein